MKHYKNSLIHALLTFCLLLMYFNASAQCNCLNDEYDNNCTTETIIEYADGTNITTQLYDAVMNDCKIRLANNTGNALTYYIYPQVFRNIDHKEIILDDGVKLLGIQGGFSDCSQSVLTFDDNVHDILIRGDYCTGEIKPLIGMEDANYINYADQGYLVGADNSGDPYINNFGLPNYVFSDGDSDPYFDNFGNPNFITSITQPQVQKDCDYNDFLCNRKIIVWCPFSWEARHIISLLGVNNVWINDLDIVNASGGDGVHVTDDRDFNTSSEIHLSNVDFNHNARNGLKITNAYCVELLGLDFFDNGNLAPITLVTPESALNIDQNTAPGSIDDFMGTLPDYALNNISIENGIFNNNTNRDISIDIPIDLTLCTGQVDIKAKNICINNSDDAIVFERANLFQAGTINLHDIAIDEFEHALVATNAWNSVFMAISTQNWTVNSSSVVPINAFDISSFAFCINITVADICRSNNIIDNLCQAVPCTTPSYSCAPNQDPPCDPVDEDCELVVTTDVKEVIDYGCECDYLFMVDESGSVSDEEWDEMNCSITNMMNALDSICEDTCDTRFALIQWASTNQQHLESIFECSPFEFDRHYPNGGTNSGDALNFLLDLLTMSSGEFKPNKKCLRVLLFTDAYCFNFEATNAGQIINTIRDTCPNIEFIVIDYTSNGDLEDCEALDSTTVFQNEFNCETGIDIGDIADTSYVYTIHVEIDPKCVDPTIIWTAYAGGTIESIYPDETTVEVNGEGFYSVEVECASGCSDIMIEYVQFDNTTTSFKMGNQTAIVKKDRTRYYNGRAYTPHEFEQLMLRDEEEVQIEHIQISPNPFTDILHILVPANEDNYNLKIFNTQGQMVYGSNLKPEGPMQIDLSDLTNGLYVVRLLNTNTLNSVTHKVMKLTTE